MAGEVGAVGKGFLTETGDLKTSAQLAKEDQNQKTNSAAGKNTPAADTSISTALGSVRGRFADNANAILSVVNQDGQNLKDAQQAVKKQLTAAKELKTALKDKDEKKIEKAQKELASATAERNAVAERIEKDNSRLVADRARNLSVGNEQVGIVKVRAVQLEKSNIAEISKPKDAEKLIESLKADKASIAEQRTEHADVKNDIKEKIQSTDEQLSKLQDRSIRALADAEDTAQALASRITGNAAQALSASNISQSIVQQLLQ